MKTYEFDIQLNYALEKGPDAYTPYDIPIENSIYVLNRPIISMYNLIVPFEQYDFIVDYPEYKIVDHAEITAYKDNISIRFNIHVSRCKPGTTLEGSNHEFTYRKFQYFKNPCWDIFETKINDNYFSYFDDAIEYFWDLVEKEICNEVQNKI